MRLDDIRSRIRAMRETGAIPCDAAARTWAGRGRDGRCTACGETILPAEVEYEIQLVSGVTILLHRECHTLWREECEGERPEGLSRS